jgi:choline kinase
MAMLTPVPVTLPDNKVPTENIIRDIVATFLTKEWPSVDPKSLTTSYHASFANGHCRVERPKLTAGEPTEPLKIFIKFHTDIEVNIEIFKHLAPSKQEEALFCYEYGQSGLGAKVYGFFKTQDGTLGRVEEFLDARNMEPEDVENAVIRADVAKGLAIFHAMKTSLAEKAIQPFYEALMDGLKKYHKMNKLKALGKEGGVSVDNLIDYDFAARLKKVVDKLESVGGKIGWCIHDVQFMNVLVKKNPKEHESKIVLIDFEFVMRNYRAFDIGGHFMQKMFKWFDEESKIANCRKYTVEQTDWRFGYRRPGIHGIRIRIHVGHRL